MSLGLPKIGVVIIGVNVERYIADCIRSVINCDYPQGLIEIVYVDGGSSDKSISIAREFEKVRVIELNDIHPTPGRGRNAGWKYISSELIQFLDADTILDPAWFNRAVPELKGKVIAVCGQRRERYPEKNIFHLITDIEWGYGEGLVRFFGGDVLLRAEMLNETCGYDENLIAGEDPDLSYRIRKMGYHIKRINHLMTTHDINMNNIKSYLKRAFRSGHAYAELGLTYIKEKEKIKLRELIRIVSRSIIPVILIVAGFLTDNLIPGIILGVLFLCIPVFRLKSLIQTLDKPMNQTVIYLVHTIFVVYPQFCGVLRYFWGKSFNNPLRNTGITNIHDK